ncbi:response regulator [Desulfobacter sp.]|uniref:response regulator n=1 Tax=Desulfobacter sp. TaxID=2294 RepID=UPI003D11584C
MVAECNTLLREGLCLMINSDENLEVVAQAADGFSAIETTLSLKEPPDLVMMDLSMSKMDGVSAIKEIKRQRPDSKIMALTIHDSDEFILECFDAGASGYCLKDSSQDELLKAIHVVISGKTYISPGITGIVMEGFLDNYRKLKKQPPGTALPSGSGKYLS